MEGELSRWCENAIRAALNRWLAGGAAGELTGEQADRAIRIVTWCGFSYLGMVQQERVARKLARVDGLRALLIDTNYREVSLRDLENNHSFKHEEVRCLVAEFPEKLQIVKKPPGIQGGRPSDVLSISATRY